MDRPRSRSDRIPVTAPRPAPRRRDHGTASGIGRGSDRDHRLGLVDAERASGADQCQHEVKDKRPYLIPVRCNAHCVLPIPPRRMRLLRGTPFGGHLGHHPEAIPPRRSSRGIEGPPQSHHSSRSFDPSIPRGSGLGTPAGVSKDDVTRANGERRRPEWSPVRQRSRGAQLRALETVVEDRVAKGAVHGQLRLPFVGTQVTHAVHVGHHGHVLIARLVVEIAIIARHRRAKVDGQ